METEESLACLELFTNGEIFHISVLLLFTRKSHSLKFLIVPFVAAHKYTNQMFFCGLIIILPQRVLIILGIQTSDPYLVQNKNRGPER